MVIFHCYVSSPEGIGLWCVNKRHLENNILVRTSEPNDLNGPKKRTEQCSTPSPATLKDADKSAGGPTFSKLLKKVRFFTFVVQIGWTPSWDLKMIAEIRFFLNDWFCANPKRAQPRQVWTTWPWKNKPFHMGMGQNPGTFCSPQVIAGIYGCSSP